MGLRVEGDAKQGHTRQEISLSRRFVWAGMSMLFLPDLIWHIPPPAIFPRPTTVWEFQTVSVIQTASAFQTCPVERDTSTSALGREEKAGPRGVPRKEVHTGTLHEQLPRATLRVQARAPEARVLNRQKLFLLH